ncbi:hypothetical protein COV18_02810 [Candidatus Woesearchaeota archaeon CG10_big_fil_rev_8_21_14_0_10_37_12]|nr:MAG: hypothetical protein COV18_02810 [Candidatus Woesearchaeota archaeon CG10_big_fil_rev_8_21_14_0_10_37_12]
MKQFQFLIMASVIILAACNPVSSEEGVVKIGFIGAMTGPIAKYGSYEAVSLGIDDLNAAGGINGKQVKLIAEDGKCNSNDAVTAVNKLIHVDKVKFILGGHCSPESVAIAPIVEENKVIMLASITTSPYLSDMGDYVFRTSPVNTHQVPLIADAAKKLNLLKLAVVYEETQYAEPIAKALKEAFPKDGGVIVMYESYVPGEADFRTIVTKVKNSGADAVFLSPQSPDAAALLLKQLKELDVRIKVFGNDILGNSASFEENKVLHEGVIFPGPLFDEDMSDTKDFIEKYKTKYNVDGLPFGFWTAEAYDGVFILADAIAKHGEDTEAIKEYLYSIKDYDGVSGKIGIDENGDGIRTYKLSIVKNGQIVDYTQ